MKKYLLDANMYCAVSIDNELRMPINNVFLNDLNLVQSVGKKKPKGSSNRIFPTRFDSKCLIIYANEK